MEPYDLRNILDDCLIELEESRDECAEQRLAMTLRYLATGDQVNSIAEVYNVGESPLYYIITTTCDAIYRVSSPIYISFPSEQKWRNNGRSFEQRWNLPHCLDTIDGKHIHIRGSLFFNYNKTYSIVLMAACNHRYEFTWIDVGAFGGESDGGIFSRSAFGSHLQDEILPIPKEYSNLPGSRIEVPYFFIGDDAFALRPDFMKPYSERNLTEAQEVYNYRISRARNCMECALGILVKRCKVLEGRIGIHSKDIDRIVLACACLHNFVMSRTQFESRSCSTHGNNNQ
ncbi:uncharacterized protein LOC131663417 [Phymastichus coffea]|uniref:uncharacterized protein LOC131663417 n=1 Tax=Phymastichus coffea TaxID=108790 RepID=UPI00273BDD9D|nr:uncharacterized protein LOC131663417 [Phymastichus coffea]